jgi:hypothetical protein
VQHHPGALAQQRHQLLPTQAPHICHCLEALRAQLATQLEANACSNVEM